MRTFFWSMGIVLACLSAFWVGVQYGDVSKRTDCLVFDAANGTVNFRTQEITFTMRCLGDSRAYNQTIPLVRVQR